MANSADIHRPTGSRLFQQLVTSRAVCDRTLGERMRPGPLPPEQTGSEAETACQAYRADVQRYIDFVTESTVDGECAPLLDQARQLVRDKGQAYLAALRRYHDFVTEDVLDTEEPDQAW